MKTRYLHTDFKLNGFSFSEKTLKDAAYSFIKEGEPYEKSIGAFLFDWLDDSPLINVHTSGSTGTPKEIQLEKQHMVNSALATGSFFDLQATDTALLCLSTDYIAGKMMLVRAMILGLQLDLVAPTSNPLAGNTKAYKFGAMVPLQVENSLEGLHHIEKLIVGGAPVSLKLKQKLQSVACSVFETYGMTETITHIAVRKIVDQLPVGSGGVENKFQALPKVLFSTDERGCLVIDAPKISNDPVSTNDMVDLISETEFEWLGRYDNVINSGGVKLHPEQIEEKLASVISQNFCLIGVSDDVLGEKLILLIEGKTNVQDLLSSIKTIPSIGSYEIPKQLHELPKFVYTNNGKLDRTKTAALIQV